MRILLEIVAGYAVWIYLACALAAAWYLRVVYLARKERRATWFPLEKEAAFQRVYTAAMASVVIAFVLAGTYFVANRLIELLPLPLEEKQALLAEDDACRRLERLRRGMRALRLAS